MNFGFGTVDIFELIKQAIETASALNQQIRGLFGEQSLWRDMFGYAKILAVAYVLVLPFELMWAKDREKKFFRDGYLTDLAHMFLTKIIGKFLVTIIAFSFVFALIETYVPLDGLREAVRSQPVWLQAIQALILSDFISYWIHRWMHESPLLWRSHACHHSSKHLDVIATVRVHPFQLLLQRVIGGAATFSLGFSIEAFGIVFFLMNFWGYFEHANFRFPENGVIHKALWPLRGIFVTPRFHHWHHAYHIANVNYGTFLTIWDRMFGTAYHPDDNSWPERYGIPEAHPSTWFGQMVYPILPPSGQAEVIRLENRALGRPASIPDTASIAPETDPVRTR